MIFELIGGEVFNFLELQVKMSTWGHTLSENDASHKKLSFTVDHIFSKYGHCHCII